MKLVLSIPRLAVLCLVWLLGCGPAAQETHPARDVVYNTDFMTVWTAVSAEMRDRFHPEGLMVEDASKGFIRSKWKPVVSAYATRLVFSDPYGAGRRGTANQSADLVQVRVQIAPNGPPWRILVDAEGAHIDVGESKLKP